MGENSRKNSKFNDEQFRIVKSRFKTLPFPLASLKNTMHSRRAAEASSRLKLRFSKQSVSNRKKRRGSAEHCELRSEKLKCSSSKV